MISKYVDIYNLTCMLYQYYTSCIQTKVCDTQIISSYNNNYNYASVYQFEYANRSIEVPLNLYII